MEKRSTPRYLINTSIVCSQFNSAQFGKVVSGTMKNCCANGLYAELAASFAIGTVLVVRTIGSSGRYSMEEGFHSLAIAEVKWWRHMFFEGEACYATGLRYVMI